MLRFLLRLVVFVTIGKFIYAEANLLAPATVPYINFAMKKLEIPPHTEWDTTALKKIAAKIQTHVAGQSEEDSTIRAALNTQSFKTATLERF